MGKIGILFLDKLYPRIESDKPIPSGNQTWKWKNPRASRRCSHQTPRFGDFPASHLGNIPFRVYPHETSPEIVPHDFPWNHHPLAGRKSPFLIFLLVISIFHRNVTSFAPHLPTDLQWNFWALASASNSYSNSVAWALDFMWLYVEWRSRGPGDHRGPLQEVNKKDQYDTG